MKIKVKIKPETANKYTKAGQEYGTFVIKFPDYREVGQHCITVSLPTTYEDILAAIQTKAVDIKNEIIRRNTVKDALLDITGGVIDFEIDV